MSDPQGQVSDLTAADSPLNQSSTSGEFTDSLPDTFKAWLADLKPTLESDKNNTQPVHLAAAGEPAPGECRFEGRIEGRFEGTLHIDGYATGFLHSLTGTLIIAESGEVESDIIVATAIIDGILRGDIHATERVELQSHARVFGNIESPALAIQPGAVFEGRCHFLPSPFKPGTASDGKENPQTSHVDASLTPSQGLVSELNKDEAEAAKELFAAAAR